MVESKQVHNSQNANVAHALTILRKSRYPRDRDSEITKYLNDLKKRDQKHFEAVVCDMLTVLLSTCFDQALFENIIDSLSGVSKPDPVILTSLVKEAQIHPQLIQTMNPEILIHFVSEWSPDDAKVSDRYLYLKLLDLLHTDQMDDNCSKYLKITRSDVLGKQPVDEVSWIIYP